MKVMFVVSDYPGHYAPMVPLGWALQAAGHEVRLVCGPAHAPVAARTGLPTVPRGVDVDTVQRARIGNYLDALDGDNRHRRLAPVNPLTGTEMATPDAFDWAAYEPEYLRQMATDGRDRTRGIAGFARAWRPDLVVYDLLSPEGMVAAHAAGVPAICHLWGPTGTDETGRALARLRPDIPPPVRECLGIALDADLIPYVIDPCPPAIAPATRAARIPVRYVPYSGPAAPARVTVDLPSRPRICVVWSNSLSRIFGPASFVVPVVVRAAEDLDVELVLALPDEDVRRLGPVPAGVHVLPRYPLSLLLGDAVAVVHHGGAGCLMTAVAAGVPQLALPFGAEQEMIAGRLGRAGAGIAIRGSSATVAGIRRALRSLLDDPGYLRAARALAARNDRAPSPADLVPVLIRLADSPAGTRGPGAVPVGVPQPRRRPGAVPARTA